MLKSIIAGSAYFAIIFAIGVLLSTVRDPLLTPHLGVTTSLFIVLPIIVFLAWVLCEILIHQLGVSARLADRVAMGATAFGLLMCFELFLSIGVFETSISDHFNRFKTFEGGLSLIGQIILATFPVLRKR